MDTIDVNKTVDNPNLIKALNDFISNKTEKNTMEFSKQLNAAIFLIPTLQDEVTKKENGNGTVTIEKGSIIKFLNFRNNKNECYLPLFTNWPEIRLWAKENVTSIIMPASEAWGFINMKENDYYGAIINPGSTGCILSKDHIRKLIKDNNI